MCRLMARIAIGAAFVLGSIVNSASAARWANALFSEKGHDFGPVPRGANVRHPFVLTNRLPETITIAGIRSSCGCTSGTANTTQVPPGQSGVVEAQMDTRNFVGQKDTVLYVTLMTTNGREAEVPLGVSATILSDIVLNPGTIDFGAVTKGQTPKRVLSIDRIGSPTWKVVRMVSTSRVLNATLVESARTSSAISYTLTVSLKPGTPPGIVRDEILLLTNDPETANIPVLVNAQVRGDLTASPSVLALGKVTSAGGVQGKYVIRASRPFAILAVEGEGDGFVVGPFDTSRRPLHVLTIAYRPEEGKTRGHLRRQFRVHTDLADELPLDLTATLHVGP